MNLISAFKLGRARVGFALGTYIYMASILCFMGADTNAPPAKAPEPKAVEAKPPKAEKKTLSGAELYSMHCNRCHAERYPTERTPMPFTGSTTAPPLTPKQADTTVKLPVDLWKKAGFATPEDTLKTRGWAIVNGDRQEFTQSIYLTDGARKMIEDQVLQMAAASKDPEAPRIAQQALAENWGAEEAVLMPMMAANQNNPYTDYTILSQQSPSDDEDDMVVQTETSSGAPTTETLKFQRFGDTWKIVIDEAAVAHK